MAAHPLPFAFTTPPNLVTVLSVEHQPPAVAQWNFSRNLYVPNPFGTDDWDTLQVHDPVFGWQAASSIADQGDDWIRLEYEFEAAYDEWTITQQPNIFFEGPALLIIPQSGTVP